MSNRKKLLESTERAILDRRPGMLVGMLHVHVRRLWPPYERPADFASIADRFFRNGLSAVKAGR